MTDTDTDPDAETSQDRTDAPHPPDPIRQRLSADPGFASILRTAAGLCRARPLAAVPFALASLLGAASTIARRESSFPVGVAPFPEAGLLRFRLPVVPSLEPVVDLTPALFLGLKPRFLVVLLGWQILCGGAVGVALAACLWMAAGRDGTVPPLERVGWLVAYAASAGGAGFAVVYVLGRMSNPGVTLLAFLAIAPVAIALFLTPASLVLGGHRPRAAIRESVRFAADHPFSIPVLLLGVGYVGYALTGVAQFAPASPLGTAAGTVVSATVTGTAHALVVAASYRLRPIPIEE
ncbi:hypothetical protein [Halopiger xanaduensis]|uniref:Uncharacterized protein n=1 Tax=Halopiger xanaduensis (strain DSM 18323 / JCM 14033 / SH-6) TaxID=797210 RepID=F8DBQ8_HALXS|nr:hypothetical protein [Halopiger xanaduensis]AEH38329.1 hypothetical protein Halxa_3722 [Halopiger xanaduensis SH-6]